MPVQPCPIAAPIDIPEPDCLVKATTGQQAPIRAPGHRPHPLCMPSQRLAQAEAFHVPQPHGSIPAPAGELRAATLSGDWQTSLGGW